MELLPWVKRLSIQTKGLSVVRLDPNWAQLEYIAEVERQLYAKKPVGIITLKARQLGISTITEAIGFLKCQWDDGTQGMVVAHELDPSMHLLGMQKLYDETYPFRRLNPAKFASQKHIVWANRSAMRITTASNVRAGRARTLNFLHASEVGFWPQAEVTMLGLRQTIPVAASSMMFLESTANGVGNYFHKQWQAAVEGEVDMTPMFFPWHKHPEYTASAINLDYVELGALDAEEKVLREIGISDDRLAWRRWAIKNLTDRDVLKFHQEYPSTAEEAFITSGSNVFPHNDLRVIYEPMNPMKARLKRTGNGGGDIIKDDTGPLKVFKYPSKDRAYGNYILAADPTFTTQNDFSAIQVINRNTMEQVAVWHGRIDAGSFAEEVFKLGAYYNYALVVPEIEGPGRVVIGKLQGMDYPNIYRHKRPEKVVGMASPDYGWSTNSGSKPMMIGWLLKFIVDHAIVVHDAATMHELQNYAQLENGEYGPGAQADYDDLVTSLAMGVTAHVLDGPAPMSDPGISDVAGQTQDIPPWETWGEQANY